jgi:hypothetical protein
MGKIHKGILKIISEYIATNKTKNFVETGTYHGSSLDWAAETFENVSTIEINEKFFIDVQHNFRQPNIKFYLGDSRNILRSLAIAESTLFWLDAHSGGGNFGDTDDCPLLDELEYIANLKNKQYIIIDDVYAFCFPLPAPFEWKKWPSLNDIFKILNQKFCIMIKDNFLLAIPIEEEDEFKDFLAKL